MPEVQRHEALVVRVLPGDGVGGSEEAMIQQFIEYLKASGLYVTDFGQPWHVLTKGGERMMFTLLDTDEEQPEVREFCEQEMVRLGASGFDYGLDDGVWSFFAFRLQVRGQGKTKTAAAVSALTSLPVQESRG